MIELKKIKEIEDFKKLLDIQKNAWGFSDLDTEPHHLMTRVQKYGGLVHGLFAHGELVGLGEPAVERFVELVDQFAATRADADPHPLGLRFNPAQQVDNQGRYAEAEAEFRTILDIRRQLDSIGEDHPHMLRTRYWLARMLDAQDRCAEADALLGGLEGELLARCDEGHHYVRELLEYLAGR